MCIDEHWSLLAAIEGMQRVGFSEPEIGDFVRSKLGPAAAQDPVRRQLRISGRVLAAVKRYGAEPELIAAARAAKGI